MKKFLLVLIFSAVISYAQAGSVALVYENAAAVKAGKSTVGSLVSEGILVPSSVALAGGTNLMAGQMGGRLRKADLIRLDMDLSLALIRFGDEVSDPALQKAFETRAAAVTRFLPATPAPAAACCGEQEPSSTEPVLTSTSPFIVKIDGVDVDSGAIALNSKLKKSKFKLELVSTSTAPVWNVDVTLKSTPKLGFWKQGKKVGMNDVPMSTFNYGHQMMFKPLRTGESFVVTVEVFYIEEPEYDWSFVIKSKGKLMGQKTVHVKFN